MEQADNFETVSCLTLFLNTERKKAIGITELFSAFKAPVEQGSKYPGIMLSLEFFYLTNKKTLFSYY